MERADNGPLIDVRGLKMYFPVKSGFLLNRSLKFVKAVDGVDFFIRPGQTLGLVGESGCGKSTTGRAILQRYRPTAGEVYFRGHDLCKLSTGELRPLRRDMQMIFQDPFASLNPRMKVADIVGEPLVVHNLAQGKAIKERVRELLLLVGLNPHFADRFPHEFSGGQRQRIGVARALASNPSFIVADEPISALDVSIRAQIINLLQDLQDRLHLTFLFIAHDLSVVRHISHSVAVMYLGRIVETANHHDLYEHPLHPYTRALLSAVPVPRPSVERQRQRIILKGDLPSPVDDFVGCRFRTRCAVAVERCKTDDPPFEEKSGGHWAACWMA